MKLLTCREITITLSVIQIVVEQNLNSETANISSLFNDVKKAVKIYSEYSSVSEEEIWNTLMQKESFLMLSEYFFEFLEHGCKNPYDKTLWDENGEYIGE